MDHDHALPAFVQTCARGRIMRSVTLQKAYKEADKIDDHVAKYGLPPLIRTGLGRFEFTVIVVHEEGTVLIYRNAYCVRYEQWLVVIPEHHEIAVFYADDLAAYSLNRPEEVTQITLEGDTFKIKK
jgi:hypothetical protein